MTFSFCSFFFFFCSAEAFQVDVVSLLIFFPLYLHVILKKKKKSHCQDHCQIAYSFFLPPSKFTLSGLMFNSLIHSELITVSGVQFHCGCFSYVCLLTYLAASGLCGSTQHLHCVMRDLLLQRTDCPAVPQTLGHMGSGLVTS